MHIMILIMAHMFIILVSYNNSDEVDDESNGSSETPPTHWPAHARKIKKKEKGFTIFIQYIISLFTVQCSM